MWNYLKKMYTPKFLAKLTLAMFILSYVQVTGWRWLLAFCFTMFFVNFIADGIQWKDE